MKKFELGRIALTIGALIDMKSVGVDSIELLGRHQGGYWLEITKDDIRANKYALKNGGRIFSRYPVKGYRYRDSNRSCSTWEVDGVGFWVITEADGSATMILLPNEY